MAYPRLRSLFGKTTFLSFCPGFAGVALLTSFQKLMSSVGLPQSGCGHASACGAFACVLCGAFACVLCGASDGVACGAFGAQAASSDAPSRLTVTNAQKGTSALRTRGTARNPPPTPRRVENNPGMGGPFA